MNTPLQIEYRGYIIHFAENQEVWRCQALDVDGEKMGTVKRKIDKIIAASRKIPIDLNALHVDHWNSVQEVRIVAFAQPRKAGQEPDSVWCMASDRERYFDHTRREYAYRETEVRKKLDLKNIYGDTPENRATFAEIRRLQDEQKKMDAQIKEAKEAAVKVSLAHLKTDEVADVS